MADNLLVANVRVKVAQSGHHLRPNKAECPMKLTCAGLCLAEQSNHAQPGTMAMSSKKVTSRHCCVTLGQILVVFFRTRTLTCRRPLPLCPAVWRSISASGHGFPPHGVYRSLFNVPCNLPCRLSLQITTHRLYWLLEANVLLFRSR